MANPRLSDRLRKSIETELDRGRTNAAIAKKLGCSTGTVSNVRRGVTGSEVELRRLRRRTSDAERRHEDALREIERLQLELDTYNTMADYLKNFRPVKITPKRGGKGEATAIICCNDWHYEEEVDRAAVNDVNEYNPSIARKRTDRFWATAASLVDMCRSRSRIDTIVVNILGDLINGYIHEEFLATNALTPTEALLAVFDQLISGLVFLQKETRAKEIIVPCVCGNHGRWTKKRWSKKSPAMSFEGLLYTLIAKWLRAMRIKNIRLVLPQGDLTYITIYDRVIRITHGDNIRYCGGIGGIHIPLRKAIDAWNTQVRADYNYIGHWHTDITGEDYRLSGSMIGFNEYGIKIKARFQRPSQAFELQHPRYGATARFPIYVE
jgi:hypothetical protein